MLKKRRSVHKWLGRLYAYNVLLINVPAGLILAIDANGFLPGKIAFITLDCLWFIFTLKAVLYIKQGNIVQHKEFMIRSYALTLSALTLRLWKQFFVHSTTLDPALIYMLDAWLGFMPNLLIAEWLIYVSRNKLPLQPEITQDHIRS